MNVAIRLLALMTVVAALVACAGSTTGTSPSAAATSAASVGTVVAATPAPTSTFAPNVSAAADDPANGLRIGGPYALAPLTPATAAALEAVVRGEPGGAWSFGGREVRQDNALVGYVLVLGLGSDATDADFQNGITGLAAAMGVTPQQTSIDGTSAWTASTDTVSAVVYRAGDAILDVETQGRSLDVARAIAAALIAANR